MKYHSNRKVRPMKKMLINVLYKVGVKPRRMVGLLNLSRATIYRYIDR